MSQQIIAITSLNDGINIKSDPSAISEGGLQDCVGFDLTEEGVLKTAGGIAANDISLHLPTGDIRCKQTCYIGSARFILATTSIGLYANGSLVYPGFTGRFKAVSFISNIYLVNGNLAIRFDGVACYKWGIVAPTTVPTITRGAYRYKTIDTFDDLTNWTAHQVNCIVSRSTIGSELVTNGTFTGSAASWTYDPVDWTYDAVDNAMDKDADGVGVLNQPVTHVIGKQYLLSFIISNWTIGTVTPTFGGIAGTAVGADGTYYQVFTPTTAGDLIFIPTNTSRFTIDTISIFEINAKEGTNAAKFTVVTSAKGHSYVNSVIDATKFSGGETSIDGDYLRFWLYVDDLLRLEKLSIVVDVGDGGFSTDYYSYTIICSGMNQLVQTLGMGESATVIPGETVSPPYTTLAGYTDNPDNPVPLAIPADAYPARYTSWDSLFQLTQGDRTGIDPTLLDQTLHYWRRSDLFTLQSSTWQEVKIPKSMFIQSGDGSKNWSTIAAIKIAVEATSLGAVNVYFDDMKIVGGSDLVGDYWFMYSWGRTDTRGNILHESPPSRNNTTRQINIIGPVNFDRHPLTYAARPLSIDPQVNCGIISAIGSSLADFWELAIVEDNTTTTATLYDIGDKYVTRKLVTKSNEPAPAGTDLLVHQNKIWMVGDYIYPRLIRSSDILSDGTIAPEGWPTRNAYEPEDNQGGLLNIRLVNKTPVVKGEFGEWTIQVLDPTDYLQVKARKVSPMGLLGQDAVVDFETTNIYPSLRGFIESDGTQAKFILPEIQPLIDSNISSAIGINAGLVSYFTYRTSTYGDRTAKVDLFRGKPRFTNLNNILFSWLEYDPKTDQVYGVKDGNVYIIDSGSTNEATNSKELYALLKSKFYSPGGIVSWTRLELTHNTGGIWYRLEVYIDDVFIASMPFISTTRTVTNFREFGPTSGFNFQFVITGDYITPGTIYFPIRIFYNGGK